MAMEAKQREWIWEFFLKNCTDARMIQELMKTLPFPDESLELKRLLLLRSLSLQMSAGVMDEFTLDILKGMGELFRVARTQDGRGRGRDPRKPELVVDRDWTTGTALPQSACGAAGASNENYDIATSGAGAAEGTESGEQWEVELAVMAELAVGHLRQEPPDMESFDRALARYWGDAVDNGESWSAGEREKWNQIGSELRRARIFPEALGEVAGKYSRVRVDGLLKSHLERAWAGIGQTFLERVSADVVSGKYNPVNSDTQRPQKKAETPSEDGKKDGDKEWTNEKPWIRASRGRFSKSREKKQKKFAVWDLDGDEDGGDAPANPIGGAERSAEPGGDSGALVGISGHEDEANVRSTRGEVGEAARSRLPSVGKSGIDARGRRFGVGLDGGGLARVLDFEEPAATEEATEAFRAGDEKTKAAEAPGLYAEGPAVASSEGPSVDRTECRPENVTEAKTAEGSSNAPHLARREEASVAGDLEGAEEASNSQKMNEKNTEPNDRQEAAQTETVVPPSSMPVDLNHIPLRAGPQLVTMSPVVTAAAAVDSGAVSGAGDGDPSPPHGGSDPQSAPGTVGEEYSGSTKKRKPGVSTEVVRQDDEATVAEADVPSSNKDGAGTFTTHRNLRRKQNMLEEVLQDPLPSILTGARPPTKLLEWNATARTLEWETEDDIEETQPNSPSASKRVRLPHPVTRRQVSPLAGSKSAPVDGSGNARQNRRKPRRWSEKEVQSLKEEVNKYGKGRWKHILANNLETFQGRTEVDLKDKWRNLERFEGVGDIEDCD